MAIPVVPCGMLLNSVSGVGIIIMNKYIVTEDAFDYAVVLSFCHYLFTLVFAGILAKTGFITPKQIAIRKRMTLAMVSECCLIPHHVVISRLYSCHSHRSAPLSS